MAKEREPFNIEAASVKKSIQLLRAVNHKLRLQLLRLIHKRRRVAVTDIYTTLQLEQSVTSQHLAILRKAGFVKTERVGKRIFYTVDYDRLAKMQRHAQELLK